jgi:hypothetical protein
VVFTQGTKVSVLDAQLGGKGEIDKSNVFDLEEGFVVEP